MSKNVDNRNIRVMHFLDAYEKQECLWNPILESYKNKAARDEAYLNIIQELKTPSLTIHDVKLKVKSIRTTYTKELRLLTKNKEEGKPYSPKLFWFHRANSFLKNVSLSREKRQAFHSKIISPDDYNKACVVSYTNLTNLQDRQSLAEELPMEISNAVGGVEEDQGNTSSSTYEYKTLRTDMGAHISEEIDMVNQQHVEAVITKDIHNEEYQPHETTLVNSKYITTSPTLVNSKYITTAPTTETQHTVTNMIAPAQSSMDGGIGDDEYDLFCRSVAMQLRSISDSYSRSVAKLKIQQILFEAETGHYRNNPCITIPVNQHVSHI